MSPDTDIWRGRAILHIDMDAFFAAIEQLDHPEWRGRPVIVGGAPGGRGVVSTASYEARAFGVHSAMPSAQAARLCPDAIWVRPRFPRYMELSRAVCDIFRDITDRVQQVSIDEAYLDVTPAGHRTAHPADVARHIQERVDGLGLSCSIGIGTSKTIAKIASDHEKPHGITVVVPGTEAAFLAPLPVSALPGVGGTTAERLHRVGVRTLGDLATLDPRSAEALLGSGGPELVRRSAGIDDRPVVEEREVKSVSHEQTFTHDIRERQEVERHLLELTRKVAARLRRGGLKGRTVTLKLRYADFTTRTASRTFSEPTDLDSDLEPAALGLLRRTWTPGAGLRLIGIGVSGFGVADHQLGLFGDDTEESRSRSRALVESVDAVRERFGDGAIGFGAGAVDLPPSDQE